MVQVEGARESDTEVARNALLPRGLPLSLVLGLAIGVLMLVLSRPALLDVDLYWHIRAGGELLSGTPLRQVAADWSLAEETQGWVTTQAAAEVVLHALHEIGGWSALIAYRTVTAAVALAILARSTLAPRYRPLAILPFALAAMGLVLASQERPQQVTFIGAAWLGYVLLRGLNGGVLPAWWVVLPATAVWANMHGGWVLTPAVFALIWLARLLDRGRRDSVAWRSAVLVLVSLVGGSLTPSGPGGAVSVVRFAQSTGSINEWERTVPLQGVGYLMVVMLLIFVLSWARASDVRRSELLCVVILVGFSWMAWRYVVPSLLILSPLAARRLSITFPGAAQRREPPWSAPGGVALAGLLLLVGLATIPGREHLPVDKYPVGLAMQMADLPGDRRVLNDYDVSGMVLLFGDPSDRVGIDGRADAYGADYIESYRELMHLNGDWEPLLDRLDPDVALIREEYALRHLLVDDRGWTTIGSESEFVLLTPPDSESGAAR